MLDDDAFDANVDYGVVTGYFVRVDVTLPTQPNGNPYDYVALTPEEADEFATQLREMAQRAREAAAALDTQRRRGHHAESP